MGEGGREGERGGWLRCMITPLCVLQADENINFAEQILEAAKNIASATSTLVKSATAAQRVLVAEGRSEDGQSGVCGECFSVTFSLLYMVTL